MTERENFFETVNFGKPEYVMTGVPARGLSYLGANHQGYGDTGMDDAHARPAGSVWTDIWGTVWRKEYPGVMGFPVAYPLADMKNLKNYEWPDPDDERLVSKIYRTRKDSGGDELLSGSHRDTLWEKSYMLCGMENMMDYFYSEPEYAREILRRITDFQLGVARHYDAAGVGIASLGDDLGTQRALLLSPETVENFLVPEYRRLFGFYKERGIIINFHSCGHIEPLLETFVSLGVNILNPVQATANSLVNIIKITNKRMALSGGISTKLLLEGTLGEIEETVRKTVSLLGADGGYFCGPDQGMPFDKERYAAFTAAVEKYGKYPLAG